MIENQETSPFLAEMMFSDFVVTLIRQDVIDLYAPELLTKLRSAYDELAGRPWYGRAR